MSLSLPLISVIMPVYKGERFLREAIDSILNQTFTDFEFIIINDGSTDGTLEIIQSYSDKRIRLVNNESNQGIVACLNHGIELAQGEYIARMDADDISLPERFEKQIRFLEENPDVGVCGTWRKNIDANGDIIGERTHPKEDYLIKWKLFLNTNPISHPTILMRADLVKSVGGYNEKFKHCEDYDLWRRLIYKTKIYNIPEFLLSYRYHDNNITTTQQSTQMDNSKKIAIGLMSELIVEPKKIELFFSEKEKNKNLYTKIYVMKNFQKYFIKKFKLKNEEKKIIHELSSDLLIKYFHENNEKINLKWFLLLSQVFMGNIYFRRRIIKRIIPTI